MSSKIPNKFIKLKNKIIESMIDYMKPEEEEDEYFDPGYTKIEVNKCDSILMSYLSSVFEPATQGSAEKIMALVKSSILFLNDLNEQCDGSLIETDQREDICELIISSAAQVGLESQDYDITEQWREW